METYPKPTNKKGSKGRRNLKDHVEVREKKVGLFLSAELSSAIEECKARVASIVKECRARNRKFRDNEFDVQFDGELCLDGYSEKVKSAKDLKDVQRVTEIFEKPHFFPPGGAVNSNAIRQGSLGDCYFLSALSTVACIPGLINKICVDHDAEVGVYGFIFYRNSGWSSVVIDDMLLTNIPKYESLSQEAKAIYHEDKEQYNSNARKGGGLLLYAKAGAEEETWVPLIEKAYAKFHTNYAHLEGGFTSEALEDLTGGVSTTYMTKDILDTDRFWREEMLWVNRDRLFACGLSALDSPEDDPHKKSPDVQGLYGNHAYAVLRAVECKGKRFVVVRNPWGTGEWNGAWSDGSKEWTPEWLQVLPELNHSFGNDGQFVMEYKDFLDSFESIERTLLFDDSGWVLASSWVRAPLNMTPRAWSYGSLSFEVVIETKTKAILALTRLNDRFYRSLVKYSLVTFEFAVVRLGEKNPIETVSETRPFCSRSVSVELDLEPGPYVVYVRFDREQLDSTSPNPFAHKHRLLSRILSSKVECEMISDGSGDELIDALQFIPYTLQDAIDDDLHELMKGLAEDEAEDDDDDDQGDASSLDDKTEKDDSEDEDGPGNGAPEPHPEPKVNQAVEATAAKAEQAASLHSVLGIKLDSAPPVPGHFVSVDPAYGGIRPIPWTDLFTLILINLLALLGLKVAPIDEKDHKAAPVIPVSNGPSPHVLPTPPTTHEVSTNSPVVAAPQHVHEPIHVRAMGGESNEWCELLVDDGSSIMVGLRVYTTQKAAIVKARIGDME